MNLVWHYTILLQNFITEIVIMYAKRQDYVDGKWEYKSTLQK